MTRQFNELVHDLEQMTRTHPRHTGTFQCVLSQYPNTWRLCLLCHANACAKASIERQRKSPLTALGICSTFCALAPKANTCYTLLSSANKTTVFRSPLVTIFHDNRLPSIALHHFAPRTRLCSAHRGSCRLYAPTLCRHNAQVMTCWIGQR